MKNNTKYIGHTNNLERRLEEHNSGKGGRFPNQNRPYKLLFYEAFLSKIDAMNQEEFYKTGYGREVLNKKIINSLQLL